MGTKANPGAFDCLANAHEDEPVFILLARDRHAPRLVRHWADLREYEHEDPAKVAEARKVAASMEVYRALHMDPAREATQASAREVQEEQRAGAWARVIHAIRGMRSHQP